MVLQGAGPVCGTVFSREISGVWAGISAGRFQRDIERVPLAGISTAWNREIPAGKWLVIVNEG